MIQRSIATVRYGLAAVDFLAVLAAFVLASFARFGAEWITTWQRLIPQMTWVLPLYAGLVVLALWSIRGYHLDRPWSLAAEIRATVRSLAVVVVVTLSLLYWFKLDAVSRGFLGMFFVACFAGTLLSHAVVRSMFARAAQRGAAMRNVLVVGAGNAAADFVNSAAARPEYGIRIAGVVDDHGETVAGQPWLGAIEQIPKLLATQVIDEVAVCLPLDAWSEVDGVVQVAQEQGKAVTIPLQAMHYSISLGRIEHLDGRPVLTMVQGPDRLLALAAKRAVDLVVAAAGVVLFAPLFAVVAGLLLIREGRPCLFSQERVGLHGRRFKLYKFRTMVRDAEAQLASLADRNERQGPAFKMATDPRVTPLGRLLRRTSLDELPQLFNVLRGQMSLIGPRPPVPGEVEFYNPWHRRRLSMKPGMTGLWQVSARQQGDFDEWVELDLAYIDRWSLWLDLRILARTFPAVVRLTGT